MKKIAITALMFIMAASVFAKSTGVMLRPDGSVKVKKEKGMEWAKAVPFGVQMEVLSEEPVVANYYWKGGHSENEKWYKVKYDKKEYYVLTREFALGDKLAVLTENATLFTRPKLSTFRNAFLDKGSLVLATGNTTTTNGITFAEITFFDTDARTLKTRWVHSPKISNETNDVKACQYAELARIQSDKGMKQEFMKQAMKLSTSSKISSYLEETNNAMFNILSETNVTEFGTLPSTIYSPDGDNINVRDKPGTSGQVVGQFASGTAVNAIKATKGTEKIGGTEAQWYYVEDPIEDISGWVFGAYVLTN